MVEIIALDEFADWYASLGDTDSDAVQRVVGYLEARGAALAFPHSSAIKGASFACRELRVQSQGRPIRVLYAFDPRRQAVLILGGDKTGDDRWYETAVPRATKLWTAYLEETKS